MATAKQLEKLRRKYGLGEFSGGKRRLRAKGTVRKKRRPPRKKPGKSKEQQKLDFFKQYNLPALPGEPPYGGWYDAS